MATVLEANVSNISKKERKIFEKGFFPREIYDIRQYGKWLFNLNIMYRITFQRVFYFLNDKVKNLGSVVRK